MNTFVKQINNIIEQIKPINYELIDAKYREYYCQEFQEEEFQEEGEFQEEEFQEEGEFQEEEFQEEGEFQAGTHDPFILPQQKNPYIKPYEKYEREKYIEKMQKQYQKGMHIKRLSDNILCNQPIKTIYNQINNIDYIEKKDIKELNVYKKSIDCGKTNIKHYSAYKPNISDDGYIETDNTYIIEKIHNMLLKYTDNSIFQYVYMRKTIYITKENNKYKITIHIKGNFNIQKKHSEFHINIENFKKYIEKYYITSHIHYMYNELKFCIENNINYTKEYRNIEAQKKSIYITEQNDKLNHFIKIVDYLFKYKEIKTDLGKLYIEIKSSDKIYIKYVDKITNKIISNKIIFNKNFKDFILNLPYNEIKTISNSVI